MGGKWNVPHSGQATQQGPVRVGLLWGVLGAKRVLAAAAGSIARVAHTARVSLLGSLQWGMALIAGRAAVWWKAGAPCGCPVDKVGCSARGCGL